MPQRIRLIDAFVGRGGRGNPAGVCLLEGPPDEAWMQRVAEELNQAETAFSWPEDRGRRLRWMTPMAEVDLCGHATMAAAHAIFSDSPDLTSVDFETRSGRLNCRRDGDLIVMSLPSLPWSERPMPPSIAGHFDGGEVWAGVAGPDFMVVLPTADRVRSFSPNMGAIAAIEARGLLVTAQGDDFDMVSRFFAPQLGIPEDAVTGSAHCVLAPFWAEKLGKTTLTAHQASRRGGVLELEVLPGRVHLKGKAMAALDGWLLMD